MEVKGKCEPRPKSMRRRYCVLLEHSGRGAEFVSTDSRNLCVEWAEILFSFPRFARNFPRSTHKHRIFTDYNRIGIWVLWRSNPISVGFSFLLPVESLFTFGNVNREVLGMVFTWRHRKWIVTCCNISHFDLTKRWRNECWKMWAVGPRILRDFHSSWLALSESKHLVCYAGSVSRREGPWNAKNLHVTFSIQPNVAKEILKVNVKSFSARIFGWKLWIKKW